MHEEDLVILKWAKFYMRTSKIFIGKKNWQQTHFDVFF